MEKTSENVYEWNKNLLKSVNFKLWEDKNKYL